MILSVAIWLALVILGLAFLLTVWRVVRGPTLPDRVVALDMLVGIVIGFIALIALRTGFTLYIDIAISLGLVGFLATVAFARFILASGSVEDGAAGPLPPAEMPPATVLVAPPQQRRKPDRKDGADKRRRKNR
jgi:multicomponent Na+:H+ antiporter subunit F